MSLTLITGGARSGKSRFAEELAAHNNGKVLFVATATAGDEEMAARIRKHRESRPSPWTTLEASSDIAVALSPKADGFNTVIIDCVTLLLNNILSRHTTANGELTDEAGLVRDSNIEIDALLAFIAKSRAGFIVVTNELGEGIVPANRLSRVYRDLLGIMNQKIARQADSVYLMVCGIPLRVKPAGKPTQEIG